MAGSPLAISRADGEPIYCLLRPRGLAKKCNGSQFALKEESRFRRFRGHATSLNGIFARLLRRCSLIGTPHRAEQISWRSCQGRTAKPGTRLMVKYLFPKRCTLWQIFG